MNLLKNKKLIYSFTLFLFLNVFLYFFIYFFHNLIPFSRFDYVYNSHHYLPDSRINNEKQFNFLRSLGQYDAQWYLKIAETGYPPHPAVTNNNKKVMNGLTYAFFPLYPMMVFFLNIFFRNVELTAFIFANLFLVFNFFSLHFVIKDVYSEKIAYKTIFLLFFFPFSIFYRSYFTEGLYIFLLIWFCYFLIKKNMLISALCLGLINITKANGFLLNIYFFYQLILHLKKGNISIVKFLGSAFFLVTPFIIWMYYCSLQAGNPFYFYKVRGLYWFSQNLFATVFHNILTLMLIVQLPFHGFHYSKLESVCLFIIGFLLVKSRKSLISCLWWVSVLLYLSPLLVTDTMSFTRYQIVSFPLFIYLAWKLPGKLYFILLSLFIVGLLIVSLFFINWYWIG